MSIVANTLTSIDTLPSPVPASFGRRTCLNHCHGRLSPLISALLSSQVFPDVPFYTACSFCTPPDPCSSLPAGLPPPPPLTLVAWACWAGRVALGVGSTPAFTSVSRREGVTERPLPHQQEFTIYHANTKLTAF